MAERKTDCYFYEEIRDMGALIPTCTYQDELGYCPCNKCKYYIRRSEADRIIINFVRNRNKGDD